MSIQDLQQTLHTHAGTVVDTGLTGRAAAARRRASSIRRRRALAAVAAAVAVPLAVVALDSAPWDRTSPVVVDPEPQLFPGSFAGRVLIDSEVVTGRSEVELTAPESRNTEWRASCRGVGDGYTLHVSMDGGEPGELPCDVAVLTGRWIAYQLGPEEPAGPHTLRAWLTRTADGKVAAPASGSLGVAVYRIPAPAATVAGHQVPELEVDEGIEYALTRHEQSEPGQRTFTSTYDSGTQPVEVDWFTTGGGSTEVQVVVDGRPETTVVLGMGGPGLVLDPGRHTLTLRAVDPAPADTLLGVAWREPRP